MIPEDHYLIRIARIPQKPKVKSWNPLTPPETWTMSQCLEFFELCDATQKEILFESISTTEPKQGAAKARYMVFNQLVTLISKLQPPAVQSSCPYPDLYPPIGQMRALDLVKMTDRAQSCFTSDVKGVKARYGDLKNVEQLRFVLLYSLERHIFGFLSGDRQKQNDLSDLPHLARFARDNAHLLFQHLQTSPVPEPEGITTTTTTRAFGAPDQQQQQQKAAQEKLKRESLAKVVALRSQKQDPKMQ